MEAPILVGVALALLVFGGIEYADAIAERLFPVDEELRPD